MDSDVIALPQVAADDVNPSLAKGGRIDEVTLRNLASAPILTRAIPVAVFDSAMKHFHHRPALAESFFDMFTKFDQVPCVTPILHHVLEHLQQTSPQSAEATACAFRLCLFGLRPTSEEFPSVLADGLELLSAATRQHPSYKTYISQVAVRQMLSLLLVEDVEDMEPAVQKVLLSRLYLYVKSLDANAIVKLIDNLQKEGRKSEAEFLNQLSIKH